MIWTLLLTLVCEGLVVLGFARWRGKPWPSLLLTACLADVLTQTLLWLALTTLDADYLRVLVAAEVGIWLLEAVFLRCVPANRLTWREALLLSLAMNLVSLGMGWFLPV